MAIVPLPLPGMAPASSRLLPAGQPVPRVPWSEHLQYLDQNWEPGQHVSIIAPTGRGGKSWLITRGLLPLWSDYRVLYIDIKDYDKTLTRFGHRVSRFPNKLERQWYRKPHWFRLHIPSPLAGGPSLAVQKRKVHTAMARAYKERQWVIVGDEAAFLYDDLNLREELRDLWKRGRSQVTFIAATQEPRWVPSAMYSQPAHLYFGRLGADGNKRLGEIGGTVDYKLVREVLAGVRQHEFLFIDRTADEPLMHITKVAA